MLGTATALFPLQYASANDGIVKELSNRSAQLLKARPMYGLDLFGTCPIPSRGGFIRRAELANDSWTCPRS